MTRTKKIADTFNEELLNKTRDGLELVLDVINKDLAQMARLERVGSKDAQEAAILAHTLQQIYHTLKKE